MDIEIYLLTKSFNDATSRYRRSVASPESGVGAALIATSSLSDRDGPGQKIDPTPELTTYNIKLGWIQGVLIPCLLNIWGVMLFLRIAWIVAQAGLLLAGTIILFTSFVCVITTLSLSAICTNGELQGGGVYYIVSRSLGAELGASVGIIFAFANAVAASMNTIGFCESLNELLRSFNLKILDNDVNDVRIVGAIALFLMCLICAFGMDWETKAQNLLAVIIVAAICNYIFGACYGPSNDRERAKGFVGISSETAQKNLYPDFRYSEGTKHDFFSVFAMFFPAMTGVQAGANICGDLKNPAMAIPRGTLMALGVTTCSYLCLAALCGLGAARDASGNVADVAAGTLDACKPNCEFGLHNHYGIMQLMAQSSAFIYAGCWAATLSTALTNLLSVPRLIQALGVDRIYPGFIFFAKPYGKHGEPYRGYVLTFFVSLLFLLIAELNTIAPLITNFYLASYALINFCTFHAALIEPISWRPTFRYYNRWLSLLGFLMCLITMMIISWVMALITLIIFMTLYLLVLYKKPDVNWGSSTDAQRYRDTVWTLVELSQQQENIKSYNPQLLVLAGRPYCRPALLDIGRLITRLGSFMIVADIDETPLSNYERMNRELQGAQWLRARKDRGFFVVVDGFSLEQGARAAMHACGLGQLRPNIMLIGYHNRWASRPVGAVATYVRLIQLAYEEQLGLAILRVPETARPVKRGAPPPPPYTRSSLEVRMQSAVLAVMPADSDLHLDADQPPAARDEPEEENEPSYALELEAPEEPRNSQLQYDEANELPKHLTSLSMRKSGTYKPLSFSPEHDLDTWWLYDDGGLNILLPYIIARRGFKAKMPFRIFALAKECHKSEEAYHRMETLLQKFRIEYSSLTIIRGLNDPPMPVSIEFFNSLVQNFKTNITSDLLITDGELERMQPKTYRYLRLRELLVEHSYMASLIVLTLPLPRKICKFELKNEPRGRPVTIVDNGLLRAIVEANPTQSTSEFAAGFLGAVSAALYMAWLELLSRDLPPVLFVRGNDTSVLGA